MNCRPTILFFVLLVASAAASPLRPAPQVTLAWDPAPAAALFTISYAPAPQWNVTSNLTQVTTNNQITIVLPRTPGVTYTFAARLMTTNSMYSDYCRPLHWRTSQRPHKAQSWIPAQR